VAIVTVFTTEEADRTSKQILKEFILTYIPNTDLDVLLTAPILNESKDITRPILYFEIYPGSNKSVGMGGRYPEGDRGKFHTINLMLNIVVTDSVGGGAKALYVSDRLDWIVETYKSVLNVAGLKKPELSPYREFPKSNYGPFYGGRRLFTCRVNMRY
jgi:hypothetical protein